MTTLETRSTAELRRLRDRAEKPEIREMLNAELSKRWKEHTPAQFFAKAWRDGRLVIPERWVKLQFDPIPGQP